jgi:hypothetical protein
MCNKNSTRFTWRTMSQYTGGNYKYWMHTDPS